MDKIKLNFLFHPYNPESKQIIKEGGENAIIKEDGGDQKGRYLVGITSGLSLDYHGDRMSKECIEDMLKQAQEKDITLYANHNKDYNKAIGILKNGSITDQGEFYTEYRLWDESDPVPQTEREDADNIWRMINGIEPYQKKRQFGFSIEGFVDQKDIEKTASGRVIKKIDLDPGVSLVTKPAYAYSVATAVMKSVDAGIRKDILDVAIDNKNSINSFYEDRWEIEDAVNTSIIAALESDKTPQEKSALLEEIFDSYKGKMISLYSRTGFKSPDAESKTEIVNSPGLAKALKSIDSAVGVLKAINNKIPK